MERINNNLKNIKTNVSNNKFIGTISNNLGNIKSAMGKNKKFTILIISLLIILLILVIYKIYKYFKNFCKHSSLIFKTRPADYIIEEKSGDLLNKLSFGLKGEEGSTQKKKPETVILANKLPRSIYGYDYTYSFWLNIDDWNYGNGQPKHIFHKGDSMANEVNPGVWLYPDTNSLMIRVSTHGEETNINKTVNNRNCKFWDIPDLRRMDYNHETGKNEFTSESYLELKEHNYCRNPGENKLERSWCYPDIGDMSSKVDKEMCAIKNWDEPISANPLFGSETSLDLTGRGKCDIVNIPLQRWILVNLVMHNRTLDIFLNGKLARSCTYESVPKYNNGNLYCLQRGGFKGYIGEFRYFNRALDPDEIWTYYRCGNECGSLYDKMCNFKVKGDISITASAAGSGAEASSFSKSGSLKI